MAHWSEVLNTTIRKYLRTVEDNTGRKRPAYAMLNKSGRFSYNNGGQQVDWKVRFRRNTMQVNDGEQNVEFGRVRRHDTATLEWQGYIMAERVTKKDMLVNKGQEAIVKFASSIVDYLRDDMEEAFSEEMFIDGNATANAGRWSGLESFFGVNGTINVASGAQRSANALDPCGYPSDTYAGISTQLGANGGSWNTQSDINSTWPFGRGTPDFDYWSPVIVNYTSSAFGGTSATWALQGLSAIRFGIDAINARNSGKYEVDLVLLDNGLYRQLKELLDDKERINIENSDMRKLGFKDVIQIDGVDVTRSYGVPASTGYLLATKSMEVMSMQDQLFVPDKDPDWSAAARSFNYAVDLLGQFKMNPRCMGKLTTLA